ncbi:MAG: tol-pal system protein YbgF [Moraxellaceae bacterium]|nr:MAG: tol-pal system protein YbgF [Moraxellaceae bacterium]
MRLIGIKPSNRQTPLLPGVVGLAVLIIVSVVVMPSVATARYEPLPVEQRDAVDTNYPSAITGIEQRVERSQPVDSVSSQYYPQKTPPIGAGTVGPGSTTTGVSRPSIPSSEQWELYSQIQQMQEELQVLRGLLEQQTHELEQMKRQQRERYLDLDHRLGQMRMKRPDVLGTTEPATDPLKTVSAVLSPEDQDALDTQRYEAAYQLLKERKFGEAIVSFSTLLSDSPEGKRAPYCEYWLGELYLANTPSDLDQAKKHFVRLLTKHPKHGKVPDGMYKLGIVFGKAGDKSKARVTLKRVIKDYPSSQAAKLAKSHLKTL